ncbi:L domain-like protein [Saccharata proteae CBS 121410]|uniref:U2 small nuclear ribonucleoprotein A' n=1 Tax=Saccharata proteae CBS 121410 TaxID=1314787 RepID=A0A9P4HML3_9PEZI|nr:L domain-like protein [Saccharata proteae CBS 121410]
MVRLTADLIANAHSYINPLNERELSLRGHKIPTIENLGSARDVDCIDFTDNDIKILGGFPLLPRIQTLLLARNRIESIHPSTPKQLPNITTLAMDFNKVSELSALDPLAGFKDLFMLALLHNPVRQVEHYRLYVIWLCPKLELFDYNEVEDAERKKANELFGTHENPTELAQQIASNRTTVAEHSANAAASALTPAELPEMVKLPDHQRKRFEELIRNATTLAEVEKLEKMLEEGKFAE